MHCYSVARVSWLWVQRYWWNIDSGKDFARPITDGCLEEILNQTSYLGSIGSSTESLYSPFISALCNSRENSNSQPSGASQSCLSHAVQVLFLGDVFHFHLASFPVHVERGLNFMFGLPDLLAYLVVCWLTWLVLSYFSNHTFAVIVREIGWKIITMTSDWTGLPAEFKHIIKRWKRN